MYFPPCTTYATKLKVMGYVHALAEIDNVIGSFYASMVNKITR